MSYEKMHFDKCLDTCNEMATVFSYLQSNHVETLCIDSILRAEFVLLVSALDYYIHQIVCHDIVCNFFSGSFICTETLIPMETIWLLDRANNQQEKEEILYAALKKRLSRDSFQSSRSIEYALGLIGKQHIWKQLSQKMGNTAENIKKTLDLIVLRRNQIAHEADLEIHTGTYRHISLQDVNDCRDFLSDLVVSIDQIIYPI